MFTHTPKVRPQPSYGHLPKLRSIYVLGMGEANPSFKASTAVLLLGATQRNPHVYVLLDWQVMGGEHL